MGKIFVLSLIPQEQGFFYKLTRDRGVVFTSPSLDKAAALLASMSFDLAVLPADTALQAPFDELLKKIPCLLLSGRQEEALQNAVRQFPPERFIDYLIVSDHPDDYARALRVLTIAGEYARLKAHVETLSQSKASTDEKLRRVYAEIKGVGHALSDGVIKELEKRVALEARYLRFQKLKQKFEDILRKLYAANDVSNLLDTVPEIKEIVRAGGISIYILEDNANLGAFLKPLVWDDAYLTHSDFTRHIALLPSSDFASNVARTGAEIALDDVADDPRFSVRYREHLRAPLRSLVALPLKSGTEIIGVIEVYNKTGDPSGFGTEDRQILRGLSEHIALAMTKLNLIQYDALTSLLRPDPFFEKIIQKVEQFSKRRKETGTFAMVMGDVDWFKHYNDRNGQEAGNRLLRDLSSALKSAIREDDLLCRYGGEEFLFFLGGVHSIEEATLLTERIRKTVEDHYFDHQEYQPRRNLTMSFGVTMFPPEQIGRTVSKATLKKVAAESDLALSEAKGKRQAALGLDDKQTYKNRVCAYVRDQSAVVSKTALLKSSLAKAFSEKRLHPRFFTSTICLYRENGRHQVVGTVDLSLGGARISTDACLPVGRHLEIMIILGPRANPFQADIVYSEQPSPQSSLFHSGLRFCDPTPADRQVLQDYFSELEKKESPIA